MKRIARASVLLAILTAGTAGVTHTVNAGEDLKREALATADTNAVEKAIPQLAANTNTGPEVPMARETNRSAAPSAGPVEAAPPAAAQPRNPVWIILAVLAVLAVRFGLKRLLARGRPS